MQRFFPIGLLLTVSAGLLSITSSGLRPWDPLPAAAQTPVIGVDQNPLAKPVARFSPKRPFALTVINYSERPLEYGMTDPRKDVTEIPVGGRVDLANFPFPNCLAINTPMMEPVRYTVAVNPKLNTATVEVKLVKDISGDHCLDLRPNGTIYVY